MLPTSSSGSPTARRTSGRVARSRIWPPLDSKRIAVATLRWIRARRRVSGARSSSRSAKDSSPAMSETIAAPSSSLPSCSSTAARKNWSSRGAVPIPTKGSAWAPRYPSA